MSSETVLWTAGDESFPAFSHRRAGCAGVVCERDRRLVADRAMSFSREYCPARPHFG